MVHASTTFDRHYESKVLLAEVPVGVDTKGFDYHAVVAEEATYETAIQGALLAITI